MRASVRPGLPRGEIFAPPSKSYAHRMLLCAALADGKSVISGIAQSEDMLATVDNIRALGASAEIRGTTVEITGLTEAAAKPVFPCRESGSTLRFMIPIASAVCGGGRFTCTPRLIERGVGVYESLFSEKGIGISCCGGEINISGRLAPGEYVVPGDISSQFVTGLLFALPMLEGDSVIRVLPPVESRAYIDITADVLRLFGVSVRETSENTFYVRGGQSFHAVSATVEGDWSNAANLAAFNALGGEITLLGLNGESLQGDRACLGLFARLDEPDAVIDLAPCPDLGPIMFAVAAAKSGAHFTGTRRLRIKESDRARAMADELGKFGVRVEVGENSVTVRGGGIHAPSESLDAHNDHRIVMALTALLSLTGGVIEGAEAVRKSYPGYFDELIRLGMNIEKEA